MPLGKQAVDMPLMLVELQEGFWSPSVTFEGGHVYASGAVRITWSKNQKQQQQKTKKENKQNPKRELLKCKWKEAVIARRMMT